MEALVNRSRRQKSLSQRVTGINVASSGRGEGIQISEHFRVRTGRVDRDGKPTLRHASRLHHIGIGDRWSHTPVLMLIRDRNIRIIIEETGELIGHLTLDTTRDYQPQRHRGNKDETQA
ncbi:MAG: hypothetical protein GEU98_19765 [Pseudonocardiaceae bacterium]|nr:hypothetical protein [Pseudonocardiaceae bacterium]